MQDQPSDKQEPTKELLEKLDPDADRARDIVRKIDRFSKNVQNMQDELEKEIWGQQKAIRLTLAAMIAGGHLLFEGPPGTAKTRLVSRVSGVMGLEWKRVQFTPDLLPSDITGSEVLKENGEFEFEKGPVFTEFFLGDEINRAPPKVQSALLEAMQEKQVTSGGKTSKLSQLFTVMATQNPIEQEGTYPLPEAQLDRFLMKVKMGYPDKEAELRIMKEAKGKDVSKLEKIIEPQSLIEMREIAEKIPLTEEVQEAVMNIVRPARPNTDEAHPDINDALEWGPSPRATEAFTKVARALALMDGEYTTSVRHVKEVAHAVMEHRIGVKYNSDAETPETVVDKLVNNI